MQTEYEEMKGIGIIHRNSEEDLERNRTKVHYRKLCNFAPRINVNLTVCHGHEGIFFS